MQPTAKANPPRGRDADIQRHSGSVRLVWVAMPGGGAKAQDSAPQHHSVGIRRRIVLKIERNPRISRRFSRP